MNGMNMPHKLTILFFKDFYKRFKMIKMNKTFRKMILIGMKLIIQKLKKNQKKNKVAQKVMMVMIYFKMTILEQLPRRKMNPKSWLMQKKEWFL